MLIYLYYYYYIILYYYIFKIIIIIILKIKEAHLFGSRIKKWNFLEKETIVSFYSRRQSDEATY